MACLQVDGFLLTQTVIYFVIVATGLATSISSGLTKNDFGGLCILYGNVNCTNSSGSFEVNGGRASICTFITAINLLVCVFYAFINGCYHAYYAHRSAIVIRVVYQLWLKTLILSTVLVTILTLVSAGTLTVGLTIWCDKLKETSGSQIPPIHTTCMDSFLRLYDWTDEKGENVNPGDFFSHYYVAETSCWTSVALWLIQLMFYIRHEIRKNQSNRSYPKPFATDDFDSFT